MDIVVIDVVNCYMVLGTWIVYCYFIVVFGSVSGTCACLFVIIGFSVTVIVIVSVMCIVILFIDIAIVNVKVLRLAKCEV